MARSLKRSLGFATFGAPLLFVAVLSACGDDDDAAPGGGSTVLIQPSSYITATTGAATASAAPDGSGAPAGEPGTRATGTQVYVIQPNDNLFAIANDFDVEAEEIANFNDWSEGINHPLFPEQQINIPPDALVPSPDDPDDEESEDTEESDPDETAAEDDEGNELCPDGEVQGTYTIESGDFPGSVARRLDVTIAELDEANANTPGYGGFQLGIDILVPCGGESTDTTE